MSWTVHTSTANRQLLLRASAGEVLPDALATKLLDEAVVCGWLRASGVLRDVELCAFDPVLGTLGTPHRIPGPVQVLALEGSIGMADGAPSFTLRALLARESDRGLETLAGEIRSARIVALEVLVSALDDVTIGHALDPAAGVWLVGAGASSGAPRATPARAPATEAAPAWSGALDASERAAHEPPRAPPAAPSSPSLAGASGMTMPQRPVRPGIDLDSITPDAGDIVDHFAFGRAEVIKSDGDRLHLRIGKDGRIREIAVEMLRVSRLPDTAEGKRLYRLERRM